ncbi:MAG: hypothetical protein CFH44_00388 [Proteobacteria bacterium]|nr:MAG: hypothetical protein CFH44_00388 [Pseudomonadota bacterium]
MKSLLWSVVAISFLVGCQSTSVTKQPAESNLTEQQINANLCSYGSSYTTGLGKSQEVKLTKTEDCNNITVTLENPSNITQYRCDIYYASSSDVLYMMPNSKGDSQFFSVRGFQPEIYCEHYQMPEQRNGGFKYKVEKGVWYFSMINTTNNTLSCQYLNADYDYNAVVKPNLQTDWFVFDGFRTKLKSKCEDL